MTPEKVQERIDLLKRELWSFGEVADYYSLDLPKAENLFWRQYQVFGESRYNRSRELGNADSGKINRVILELFLQSRGATSPKLGAARLGATMDSLVALEEMLIKHGLMSESEIKIDMGVSLYKDDLASLLCRRIPNLDKTFSSYSSFVARLHREIKFQFGIEVNPLKAAHIELLKSAFEGQPEGDGIIFGEYACDYDCITDEPMGLGFQEFLDFGKPISLRPDTCSVVTWVRFESILERFPLGSPRVLSETTRKRIREHFTS